MRTYSPKAGDVVRKWHVIDAQDVVLGRLATHAAVLLRGKHKATQKWSHHHSGFPGGLTSTVYGELIEKHPTRAVEKAIKGMLPKNSLGRQIASKLKVYAGPEHPHAAQAPKPYVFNQVSQIVK